ncbi:MAG: endonuclease/exonuclease/phosphatase family protein [Hyphomicrobiales bacterium]
MLIVTYNIQWGMGQDGIVDLARIARTVGDADIICLQEVERDWRKGPDAEEVQRLCELLPRHFCAFAPAVDLDNSRVETDGRVHNGRRQYGNLTLSRWPIMSIRIFPLTKYPVYGHVNDASVLLETVVQHESAPFRVYNTHLNYLSARQRLIQAKEVLAVIADAPRQGGLVTGPGAADDQFGADWMVLHRHEIPGMPRPALLMGDFNMRTNSAEYDVLAGLPDSFYGRLHEDDLFADALTLAGLPETEGVTHPEADRTGLRRIDHIFMTNDFIPHFKRAWIDNEADGSDHQPVWLELNY